MTKRTTASELIKKLQALSPDTNLVIVGGEGGYNDVDINLNHIIHLKENANQNSSFYGDHKVIDINYIKSDFAAIALVGKSH